MLRVLVVEDDEDIAALIARYLRKAGYHAEVLHSGADVLSGVRRHPPDLLILDLMLPGASGLQICSALRAEPGTSTIPVIMLTARGEETDRIVGLEMGADDYLPKPFNPRELVARIHAVLRRRTTPLPPGAPVPPDATVVPGPRVIVTAVPGGEITVVPVLPIPEAGVREPLPRPSSEGGGLDALRAAEIALALALGLTLGGIVALALAGGKR